MIMPFGKHKGKELKDIYEEDRQYLEWLWENGSFSKQLEEELQKLLF